MLEDYRRRTVGKTKAEKERNLKEVWDWVAEQPADMDPSTVKSVAARMRSHKKQLTNLVRTFSLLSN